MLVPYTLPDSITTWNLQAFGLNPDFSMCVMKPREIEVSSELFIELKMPYSVIRNEHVEIQATVFNYHKEERAVSLTIFSPLPRYCLSKLRLSEVYIFSENGGRIAPAVCNDCHGSIFKL